MKASLFNAHGKGGLGLETNSAGQREAIFWSNKRHKSLIQDRREPRSVLDHRSPSPQTSTSTLSAPLCCAESGGGGGSSDAIEVAAVSDNPNPKWSLSDSTNGGGMMRRDEWISEPQPISAGLDMHFAGGGGEKCGGGGGLGLEDWEAMLSDVSAGVSPAQEQSFLGWIMGDMDDPSRTELRQQHQYQQLFLPQVPAELDGDNNGGLGIGVLDPASGFEPFGGTSGASTTATFVSHHLASDLSSACGFPLMTGDNRIPPPAVSSKGVAFGEQADNSPFSMPLSVNMPQSELFQGTMEDKSQFFGQSLGKQPPAMLNSATNPSLFVPMVDSHQQQQQQLQHQPPHLFLPSQSMFNQLSKLPIPETSNGGSSSMDLFLRSHQPFLQQRQPSIPQAYHLQQRLTKPKVAVFGDEMAVVQQQHQQQQHQILLDQLFDTAKMIESGNPIGAHEILARLNQQLPSPLGQPLLRTAFYFKEALLLILASGPGSPLSSSPVDQQRSLSSVSTPFDVVLKLTAYKAFSEVSPVLQFANFTCIQAILEELSGNSRIHIVDFDIGFGGHWSSLMQELSQRRGNSAGSFPLLKITAFVSPLSYHHLELQLTKDNLSQFAKDLNIPFEINILSLDSLDPSELVQAKGEAIAVNLPVGTAQNLPFPTLLRLVKLLSPKIVVSVDQGCDRSDLPFSNHFLHAFQSSMVFLDSIDATVTIRDVASKIEQFLLQPRIKNSVLGRYRANEQMLPWRTLFASAGFKPIQFSNFTETQAECLLKRVQVRGFHVEKHQASLSLYWQRGELISVSAWRC